MKKILLFLSFLLMSIGMFGSTYTLYSGTITEGDYIIVYSGKAMKNGISSSRWTYESVTISNNKITNPTNESKIVWHIAASGSYWTIYSTDALKYAVGTGTANKGGMEASPSNNGEKWTVTGTSTYEFVNKRNADANVNKNLRGNGTYGFACYSTQTGGALSLYKLTQSYTITAQSNNNSYGAVSLSGNIITGSPAEGYRYATPAYTVTSGTATVSQSGNAFTVTSSSNCTITINFEHIPTYTVRFINSGVVYDERPNIKKDSIITEFPTDIEPSEDCKKNGWEFIGWVETENGTTTVDELTVTKNDTLYALYKLTDIGTSYVTDTLTKETFAPYDGTSYKSYENIATPSGSIYAGNSAGGEGALQLRSGTSKGSTIHSGIFNTRSIGLIDCIHLKWNTTIKDQYGTEKNYGKVIKFYIAEVPFSSANDMYSGVHIEDSFPNGTSVIRIAPTPYIGIRPKDGAIYFDSILITWKIAGSEPLYSTNPKCYNAGVSIAHWYKDSVKFDIDEIGTSADIILYAANDTISEYIHVSDSSYRFIIPNLDTLKCTSLKFLTVKENKDTCIRYFKIPIMVSDTTNILRDSCDVVILSKGQLNIDKDTVSGDVTVYEGGLLNVQSKYTINSLTLRRDNDSLPYLSYTGTLDIKNGLFFEMRTDGSAWRWLTLPDTFKINTVDANNETDYNGLALVKHYNGNIRAYNGKGGWKLAPTDTIFAPGRGVTFGAYIPESDTEKKIYKIQLDINILAKEKSDKSVLVYPYGNGLDKPVNDLGWNVVGNPFMSKCNISSSNPIRVGYLKQENGNWIIEEDDLKYIVVKDNHKEYADAGYYKTIPLNIDGCNLEPFTSFFVLIPVTSSESSILTFTKNSGISYAPSKVKLNSDPFIRININHKQLGMFVSNRYSDKYEIGEDLESLDNTTYLLINGYKLLYSAINDSILEKGILIHSNSGIVSLDDKTTVNLFNEINILHEGEWDSLSTGESININGDFILLAKRKSNEIPTNIINAENKLYIYKVIKDGALYIYKNGTTYDIFGRKK